VNTQKEYAVSMEAGVSVLAKLHRDTTRAKLYSV